MAVGSNASVVNYTGNGTTTVFPIPFTFYEETDILVKVDGVTQTLTTHYSVSGQNVVFNTAPANGLAVFIARNMPFSQQYQLFNQSTFFPRTIEEALDRLTLLSQQLRDGVLTANGITQGGDASSNTVVGAGSGTARSLGARFADVTNVMDHGAACDGVTNDKAALISAIKEAVSSGSRTVLIPRVITLTTHLNSSGSNELLSTDVVTFVIPRGGGFNWTVATRDFRVYGNIEAGAYKIFYGSRPYWAGSTLSNEGDTRPEWWGAVGDGTTDDTQAITDAIQTAGGGEVVFLPKTYLVSGTVGTDLFSFQAKRLRGSRFGAVGGTIIQVSGSSGLLRSVFRVQSSKYVIEDIHIDCNSMSENGIYTTSAPAFSLDRVSVANATKNGFWLAASMQGELRLCSATVCTEKGFWLDGANATRVLDCHADLNGIGIQINGNVGLNASGGAVIVGADIENCTTHAIVVKDTTSPTTIVAPWIENGNGGDALRLDNAKHVMAFGGRYSGIGSGTNRAVRVMSGSTGIGLFGIRIRQATGNANYEAVECEAGSSGVTIQDVMIMIQSGVGETPAAVNGSVRSWRSDRATTFGTAAPSAGTWTQGDICWNTGVTAGGSPGWICVGGGAPGTWKAMANVAA